MTATPLPIDMTTLAGEERVVLRPRFDWQRFDPQRERYGDEWDWHLLEGPFVWHHDGRYHGFYSGGNDERDGYGVDDGRMCLDALAWTADGPRCLGPTITPQVVR